MNKTVNLLMIQMPNFIRIEQPPRLKQDGFNPEGHTIPINELTQPEAEEYAEEMKQAFLKHWASKISATRKPHHK